MKINKNIFIASLVIYLIFVISLNVYLIYIKKENILGAVLFGILLSECVRLTVYFIKYIKYIFTCDL